MHFNLGLGDKYLQKISINMNIRQLEVRLYKYKIYMKSETKLFKTNVNIFDH